MGKLSVNRVGNCCQKHTFSDCNACALVWREERVTAQVAVQWCVNHWHWSTEMWKISNMASLNHLKLYYKQSGCMNVCHKGVVLVVMLWGYFARMVWVCLSSEREGWLQITTVILTDHLHPEGSGLLQDGKASIHSGWMRGSVNSLRSMKIVSHVSCITGTKLTRCWYVKLKWGKHFWDETTPSTKSVPVMPNTTGGKGEKTTKLRPSLH